MAGPADDQELLPRENALGDDGTRAFRTEKPGSRRQQMSEQDEQGPHGGANLEQNGLQSSPPELLISSHKLEFAVYGFAFLRPPVRVIHPCAPHPSDRALRECPTR